MSKILYPTNGKPEFPNLTPDAIRGLKATMQIAKKTILQQEERIKSLKNEITNMKAAVEKVVSGEWSVDQLRDAWEKGQEG